MGDGLDLIIRNQQIVKLDEILKRLMMKRGNSIRCQVQQSQLSAVFQVWNVLKLVEFQFSFKWSRKEGKKERSRSQNRINFMSEENLFLIVFNHEGNSERIKFIFNLQAF